MRKKAIKNVTVALMLTFLAIYFFCVKNVALATRLNRGVCNYVRATLLKITGIFNFSIFEIILFLLPVILFLLIFYICKAKSREEVKSRFTLALFLLFISLLPYAFCIGISKGAEELSEMIIDTKRNRDEHEVSDVANYLSEVLSDIESAETLTLSEIDREVTKTYKRIEKKYSLPMGAALKSKPFARVSLFSKLGILGLYSPTGEVNINENIPKYMLPFNVAHEYAHTLGAGSEADANFLAYIICTESEKPFLRYSGALCILEYFMAEDKKIYTNVYKKLKNEAKDDLLEWKIYASRNQTKIGTALDKANDVYLNSTDKYGKGSYSETVRYVTAYHNCIK